MNLPKDFETFFRERWDAAALDALLSSLQGEPSVSIRLNPARLPIDLEPEDADGRVPWCPEGIYLKSRPSFTADPLLHSGAYYVQEASSMFLSHVLRTIFHSSFFTFHSQAVLDLCAAPGGKSTMLRSLLPDDCLLVSNEPLRARAQVLAENMAKWGHPNMVVTQTYASEIAHLIERNRHLSKGFDLILADVPCSGEGMMRKEEEAVRQWSPSFVAECAALQRSIIADIWPALRAGGFLIYSTCTFNPEEDEENVEWIARELGADIQTIPVDPAWGIVGDQRKEKRGGEEKSEKSTMEFCHFLPGQVRGEGFFCAVLRKHGSEATEDDAPAVKKEKKMKQGKGRKAAPTTLAEAVGEWLPTLPTDLLDDAEAPRVELSLSDSIRYLQREALVLPVDAPRGLVQVCYQGQRLGLVKNLGSRANNLYPKEWRIRTTHVIPHSLFAYQ